MVAILSDVHGNLPALETVLHATRGVAQAYVCLGDVVDYGPWNDECLEALYALPDTVLLEGNHERLFLGIDAIEHELPLVQTFYQHSLRSFSRRDLITGLPGSYALGSYSCQHTIDGKRIYRDTPIEIDRDYLIGHTHHQFEIRRCGRSIINCGSVGQNRAKIDVASYALYDTTTNEVTLCELKYPFERLLDEMQRREYPSECVRYYLGKRVA
jgi:predicted phosphodiesterase